MAGEQLPAPPDTVKCRFWPRDRRAIRPRPSPRPAPHLRARPRRKTEKASASWPPPIPALRGGAEPLTAAHEVFSSIGASAPARLPVRSGEGRHAGALPAIAISPSCARRRRSGQSIIPAIISFMVKRFRKVCRRRPVRAGDSGNSHDSRAQHCGPRAAAIPGKNGGCGRGRPAHPAKSVWARWPVSSRQAGAIGPAGLAT